MSALDIPCKRGHVRKRTRHPLAHLSHTLNTQSNWCHRNRSLKCRAGTKYSCGGFSANSQRRVTKALCSSHHRRLIQGTGLARRHHCQILEQICRTRLTSLCSCLLLVKTTSTASAHRHPILKGPNQHHTQCTTALCTVLITRSSGVHSALSAQQILRT